MCHIRLKEYLYKTMQYVHSHSINILGNDSKKKKIVSSEETVWLPLKTPRKRVWKCRIK